MILPALLLQAAAPAAAAPPVSPTSCEAAPCTFDGVWLDEFEGQQFFPGAVDATGLRPLGTAPAIAIDRSAVFAAFYPRTEMRRLLDYVTPKLFRVRLNGTIDYGRDCRPPVRLRRDLPPAPPPLPGCIGIGGSYPYMIRVDRVVSIVELGPLPRGGQPAG